MVADLESLSIKTKGTEEEAAEGLEAALEMETEEDREGEVEGEEGSDGTQSSLVYLELLTQ